MLSRLGRTVFDADKIAIDLAESNPQIQKRIVNAFGNLAFTPDGTLNRSYLAGVVFDDAVLLRRLNSILHPEVAGELRRKLLIMEQANRFPYVTVEAALVYEAKIQGLFDYILVVDAPLEIRLGRVMQRDGISRSDVIKRVKSQMSLKEKVARADFVIANTGSLSALLPKVAFLDSLLAKIEPT